MSFSLLIRQRLQAEPEKADRWEKAFLELQVLLASCDGTVAPAERMTLSLLSLARRNEKENREIVDALLATVERKGFDESAERVLSEVEKLSLALPASQRATVALDMLRESISIVLADDVVSDKERSFVLDRLAPGLSVDRARAADLLDKAAARADRARAMVSHAFEMFLMIVDASDRPPVLHAPAGKDVPRFLAAVDELVDKQHLASSRAVAYFIGAMRGMFWVEQADEHCADLARLAQECRVRSARAGVEARLGEQHVELEALAAEHPAPDPFLTVTQHVTAALNKVEGLDSKQRAIFREKVAPALHLDHEDLLKAAAERRSLADLHRNLSNSLPGSAPHADGDDPGRWWKFWK